MVISAASTVVAERPVSYPTVTNKGAAVGCVLGPCHLTEQNLAHVAEGTAIGDDVHATIKYSPRQCGLMGAIKR